MNSPVVEDGTRFGADRLVLCHRVSEIGAGHAVLHDWNPRLQVEAIGRCQQQKQVHTLHNHRQGCSSIQHKP